MVYLVLWSIFSVLYLFWKIECVFDVQIFVYTCAPLSDEFETTDSKARLWTVKSILCGIAIGFVFAENPVKRRWWSYRLFRFFYDRKTRAFATRIFVCRAAIHYQSDFNFDTALNTALPFYTNTAFMPHTHINIASISLYCNLLSIQSLDTTLIQKISFYATSFPHRFHATPTTLERCTSTTILPVSSPLDLRFNSTELFKIIACAIMLPQHIAFFLSHRA